MVKDSGLNMEEVKMESGGRIFGLILAAGYSSRMGAFKPLLTIGDATAMEKVSGALKNAGISDIIGVTGYQRELLAPVLVSEEIAEAYNPDFKQGMFTSIQTGIRKALSEMSTGGFSSALDTGSWEAPDAGQERSPEGFLLMLVDCPLIPAEVIRQILKTHEENPQAFIVPCYRGKKGHPLFIPGQYAGEILSYGGEGGLKAVTNRHEDKLIRLEAGTEAVVLDMDTPEGYEEILEFYGRRMEKAGNPEAEKAGDPERVKAGEMKPFGEDALKGKRLFLIRHGEIRQHREKIFLGQTDIPLSEKGKDQAVKAAEELNRYGVSINRIYTSDLTRAMETAEIIKTGLDKPGRKPGAGGKTVPGTEVIPVPKLREMSLGQWDGLYISEIRERYPEEYKKRGENLMIYKFGNEGENFYDLQYRAMKGFQSVLKRELEAEDGCRDIVIVSHSGVINVILSNLQRTELSEQIGNHIPNGGMILIDYLNTKEKQL